MDISQQAICNGLRPIQKSASFNKVFGSPVFGGRFLGILVVFGAKNKYVQVFVIRGLKPTVMISAALTGLLISGILGIGFYKIPDWV